jgi:single-stranded DNA-specific DHH superfamily exonuclease
MAKPADIEIPDEPEFKTYEHVATDPDDGSDITFTFRADTGRGQIQWTAEWEGGENSGYTDEVSDKHGAIIYRHNPRINGEKTRGSKLDDEMLASLKEDLEAVKQYRQEKREAEEQAKLAEDLTLTVKEIEYQTGTHRTKYTVSARVLKPSKAERHWDEDEQKLMDALRRELGESNGHPNAEGDDDTENPFEDVDDRTMFTVGEASSRVDGVEETLAEIDAELEREQAWAELVADYPTLRGTNADPETVRESLDVAAESGERVQVASGTASCSDPNEECSLDRLTYYATPNGEIDISRTHTY